MWPGRHTVTPIPYCEWQWEGQCRRSPTRWLGTQNECLVEKSSQRSLIWPSHHRTGRERSRIRKNGCPGTKRVPGRNRFAFGCHKSRLTQTEEREGERDKQKSLKQFKYTKIYWKERTYAWKCMNMWHAIKKASWAQPNPNLPAHKQRTYITYI